MATVETIILCVCIDHEPDICESVHYGMPQLKVSCGIQKHRQFWTAYCPACGRGGCIEHKSAYLALKAWNEMQTRLWKIRETGLMPWAETTTEDEDSQEREEQP